jgi:apolipoprotein N-acyltransferase
VNRTAGKKQAAPARQTQRPVLFMRSTSGLSLLSLIAGALCVAGFAPLSIFPLQIAGLALLAALWRRASPGQAFISGWAWGAAYFLIGVSWVYVSIHDFGGLSSLPAAAATAIFCLGLALFPAAAGGLFARLRGQRPSSWGRTTVLWASIWSLMDLLRGTLWTGFPWLATGYAHTPPSPWAGFAPWLGVYGVGALVACCAAGLGFITDRRTALKAASLALLLCILGAGLGTHRFSVPVGAPLSVSLLQGNIAQDLKWTAAGTQKAMDVYSTLAQSHPADLIILPETAVPLLLEHMPHAFWQTLTAQGAALWGVPIRQPDGRFFNAAVLAQREAPWGETAGLYAKRHLVPFGEYAPPGFAWFFDWVSIPMSDFSAGGPHQPLPRLGDQALALTICYEDLFGNSLRSALPEATLLINLSNTAWFGRSWAQAQHVQIAQMRALETARPMLRATNTGMTALIAPDGTIPAQLPPFVQGALSTPVQGYRGTTPYVTWGDTPALWLALMGLACALWVHRTNGK